MTTINSVWSSYGHTFLHDDDEHVSCLTCGAMYQLVETPDGPHDGEYQCADGSEPAECTRDTSMAHGYPGERHDGNAGHDCCCLLCA